MVRDKSISSIPQIALFIIIAVFGLSLASCTIKKNELADVTVHTPNNQMQITDTVIITDVSIDDTTWIDSTNCTIRILDTIPGITRIKQALYGFSTDPTYMVDTVRSQIKHRARTEQLPIHVEGLIKIHGTDTIEYRAVRSRAIGPDGWNLRKAK